MKSARAFTMVELLVGVAIVAVLLAIIFPAYQHARRTSWRAVSTHSLRQLGLGGANYLAEHNGEFWKYRENVPEGIIWWFGFESNLSTMQGDGERYLDLHRGPLGPYAIASGGIKDDPAFTMFEARHKPKYKNGNYGYGYNGLLGGGPLGRKPVARLSMFDRPQQVVMFATSAQVNTFQAPATQNNPMIEEFYLIDDREITVHFRYEEKALAVMLDGSIQELPMDPSTRDTRMPSANIGRFGPIGSRHYLGE